MTAKKEPAAENTLLQKAGNPAKDGAVEANAKEPPAKKGEAPKERSFSLEQLLRSAKYAHRRDALRVVLEPGQQYTLEEVDQALEKFMKGGK